MGKDLVGLERAHPGRVVRSLLRDGTTSRGAGLGVDDDPLGRGIGAEGRCRTEQDRGRKASRTGDLPRALQLVAEKLRESVDPAPGPGTGAEILGEIVQPGART